MGIMYIRHSARHTVAAWPVAGIVISHKNGVWQKPDFTLEIWGWLHIMRVQVPQGAEVWAERGHIGV